MRRFKRRLAAPMLTAALLYLPALAVQAEPIESTLSVASRLNYFDFRQSPYTRPIEGNWQLQNRLNGAHSWQELEMIWQLQYDRDESHDDISDDLSGELTELSWNHSWRDRDLMRLGKLNMDFDNSNFFRPLGFFQTPATPFDDFASNEGLWQAAWSYFGDDWVITPLVAEDSLEPHQDGQEQWGLALQRDMQSLSFTAMLQQYRAGKLGAGADFSYVHGVSWSFHGSGFVRKGSRWLDDLEQAQTALGSDSDFNQRDDWMPRWTLGAQWSGEAHSLQLEWNYDRRRLTGAEQDRLYQLAAPDDMIGIPGAMPPSALSASDNTFGSFSQAVAELLRQRHQRQYGYWRYGYDATDWNWQLSGVVGADLSQLVQVKQTWLPSWELSLWFELNGFFGDDDTEFGRVPSRLVSTIGLQYFF